MIWMGTDKGLFSYDGYSVHPHFSYGDRSNSWIYCGIIVGENYQIGEVTATVVNPVRYQVRGNEVFLTPFFGGPEAIILFKERIVYVYEIIDTDLIKKYK